MLAFPIAIYRNPKSQKCQVRLKAYNKERLTLYLSYLSSPFLKMAGALGLEPRPAVLETGMLPLTPYPYIQDGIFSYNPGASAYSATA